MVSERRISREGSEARMLVPGTKSIDTSRKFVASALSMAFRWQRGALQRNSHGKSRHTVLLLHAETPLDSGSNALPLRHIGISDLLG